MQRIFCDTEFTGFTDDAELISIGLIAEDGQRTFYAEVSNHDWNRSPVLGNFAREHVLPLLQGGEYAQTTEDLARMLTKWIEAFDSPVTLAIDSLQWDWHWVQALARTACAWPKNLSTQPLLLTMNYLKDFEKFEVSVARSFAAGLRRHHALDDAKANRLGWIVAGGDIERPWSL